MPPELNIAAVSYANTLPFLYGIEHTTFPCKKVLKLEPPSRCAALYAGGWASVALVPAGALPLLSPHKLLPDYCIGASGNVASVLLLSRKPIHEIRSIGLDTESMTSVLLCRVLAKHHWKMNPRWMTCAVDKELNNHGADAFVVIGDKAFVHAPDFPFVTDLAGEWFAFTGMPFVFAVWVVRPELPGHLVAAVRQALELGVSSIPEVAREKQKFYAIDLLKYLSREISYPFDTAKHASLRKFLTLAETTENSWTNL